VTMPADARFVFFAALCAASAVLLSACGGGGGSRAGGDGGDTDTPPFSEGRTFEIQPGADATTDMVAAMIQLRPGDTLSFGCGFFELDQGLLIQATEDVLIKGCGRDRTVLSFRDSINATGLEALNVRGITVQDLTILDSPGDAFKLKGVKWGTLKNIRAIWSGGGGLITADNMAQRLNVACTSPPLNEGDPTPDYVPSS